MKFSEITLSVYEVVSFFPVYPGTSDHVSPVRF